MTIDRRLFIPMLARSLGISLPLPVFHFDADHLKRQGTLCLDRMRLHDKAIYPNLLSRH